MSPGIGIGIGLPFIRFSLNKYIQATGGDITRDGDYLIHTITGTDTFDVTQTGSGLNNSIEYLIVAGGGSGGGGIGGGGGAGGYLSGNYTPAVQSYAATIGAGGVGNVLVGTNGNDSSIFGISAIGGGAGASRAGNSLNPAYNAVSGGSGGGGSGQQVTGANGTTGQGSKGGDAVLMAGNLASGGGGGAGFSGEDSNGVNNGDGGDGIANSITGVSVYYGGGGGSNSIIGADTFGGLGGGGNGGKAASPIGGNGQLNTGGGGGGGYDNPDSGGTGGSGIIIVKYYSPENPFPANLLTNLISRWKLDGNSNDSVGSNNGTDTAMTYSQAKINDGGIFDGTAKYTQINDSSDFDLGSGDFTLSFIVKSGTDGIRRVLFGQAAASGGSSTVSFGVEIDASNNLIFDYYNGIVFSQCNIAPIFNDGLYHQIVISRVGNILKGYKNSSNTYTNNSFTDTISSQTDKFAIGCFGEYLAVFFNGELDEILLYKGRGLSAAEVLQLYNYYNS